MGYHQKKGLKKIIVSISQPSKEFIQINIEDNGIGRIEASKIKAKKVIHRKSIGIELTKERLSNFVKNYQNSFSLTYNDLVDDNKNASGTKLLLKIPLF